MSYDFMRLNSLNIPKILNKTNDVIVPTFLMTYCVVLIKNYYEFQRFDKKINISLLFL